MDQNHFFGSITVLPGIGGGTSVIGAAQPPPAPAQPAPPAQPVTNEWKRWIAENVLLGQPSDSMVAAMVKAGLDRATSAREVEAARTHPYLQAAANAPGATGAPASRLAKREWVLELSRRSALQDPETAAVPVVHRPSREQFLHDYYAANRPVLIQGAMDDWPAMTKWTMDGLKQRLGSKRVEVQAGRNSDANYEMNSTAHKTEMSFGEYIDKVTTCGRTNDFYMTANNSGKNREALAELWNDIILFPRYLKTGDPSNSGFFWFGPAGTLTPLHHDLTNNFMAQVVGRKLIKLIAPYEAAYVYNHRHCFSQVDPTNPDFDRFPLFRNARVIDVVLNPGELLFLPIGWWHHVTGLDVSITMTFTNFVFDNDFSSFYTTYNDV